MLIWCDVQDASRFAPDEHPRVHPARFPVLVFQSECAKAQGTLLEEAGTGGGIYAMVKGKFSYLDRGDGRKLTFVLRHLSPNRSSTFPKLSIRTL
jgi:hypothetical protein